MPTIHVATRKNTISEKYIDNDTFYVNMRHTAQDCSIAKVKKINRPPLMIPYNIWKNQLNNVSGYSKENVH